MLKQIVKGSFIIFCFKAIGAGSVFFTHLLISRLLGVESLGIYNLIFSLLLFLSIVNKFGIDVHLIRKIPELEKQPLLLIAFLRKAFAQFSSISIILALVLFIGSKYLNQFFFKTVDATTYLQLLSVIVFFYSLLQLISNTFRGFNDIMYFSFLQNVIIQLTLIISIITLYFIFKIKFDVVYLLYIIILGSTFLSIVLLNNFIFKKFRISMFSVTRDVYPENVLKNSYPMLLAASSMYIMTYTDSFMISYFLDLRSVGLYSAILKLSIIMSFLCEAISSYIAPKIAKAYLEKDTLLVKKIYKNTILILVAGGLPILILYMLFPEFFLGLFGEDFKDEVLTFHVYNLVAFIGGSLFGPIGYFMVMTDNQHTLKKIMFISLFTNIILNLFLIPLYGILGAAITALISTLLWKILSFLKLKKQGIL